MGFKQLFNCSRGKETAAAHLHKLCRFERFRAPFETQFSATFEGAARKSNFSDCQKASKLLQIELAEGGIYFNSDLL